MDYRIKFDGSVVIRDAEDEDDAIEAFDMLILGINDMLGVGDDCMEYTNLHFNPTHIYDITKLIAFNKEESRE
jgi:hypothetical protein